MKAMFLKAPFLFEQREAAVPDISEDEVLLRVKACGFCGHDMVLARGAAKQWTPFGHEISGIVERVGAQVKHLRVGDRVAVETSAFDPCCDAVRNGRPELVGRGEPGLIDYMGARGSMGFAEFTSAPACLCVPIGTLSFEEGALIEPLGVAMDLVKTADIHLNDDVLVYGVGAIGLMALQLARLSGARNVYAAGTSRSPAKSELARAFGATDVILTDRTDIRGYPFPRGGVDRVLVTAPPKVIPGALELLNLGGILSFIGIAYGEDARVELDTRFLHHRKLQIRASDAVPALYFPTCIDLVESGRIDVKLLITHRFSLDGAADGLLDYIRHPAGAVKAVMVQ